MSENKAAQHDINLTLIGCGKMGFAMLQGWMSLENIKIFDIIEPFPSDELKTLAASNDRLAHYDSVEEYCQSKHENAPHQTGDACLNICIIAVKPQMMQEVLQNFIYSKDQFPECRQFDAVISIAAGVALSMFELYFPNDVELIRVMPNTPAAIGKGASVYCARQSCPDKIITATTCLLEPLGKVYRIDNEDDMHAVTAISGSGPAYIFALTESLAKAAIALGIPQDVAEDLARQTVIGAASLMEIKSHRSAAELREAVTSPGGTTQAALEVLQGKGEKLDCLLKQATWHAQKRSKELAAFDKVN
jgi:pyrroline-5-carboxylate reductase